MYNRFHRQLVTLGALVALVLGVVPAIAQSTSELLEKGIYLEETAGQVDQAIEIYRRILNDATADRSHVAEALLRLGMCHLQQGDRGAAAETFDRLLAEYPEQEQLVARAREHMPQDEAKPLELLPAPWEDGELTRMTLKLASGVPIGAFLITVDAAELEGEELWRLQVRQKVFSDADNQAVRRVFVRPDTMAPVKSAFQHTAIGRFEARYGDGSVNIRTIGGDAPRTEKLDGRVFDSEEVWHLFRRLPLEVGYQRTIQIISPAAGAVTPLGFEVTRTETVKVPAGEFECFRVELSLPQVFWFSTDPSRVLVKWEASGVSGELEEHTLRESDRRSRYSDEHLGLRVTLPPDWMFHSYGSYPAEVLFLLDPEAQAQTRMEIRASQVETGDCFYQAGAQRKLDQARTALRDYALRNGTWREWYFEGWPAVSFIGDYRELEAEKVHYWTLIQNGEFCVEFTLKVAADRFDALRAAFDTIIESYQAPPPPPREVSKSAAAEAARAVLDDFHEAAGQADPARFFTHLASDAIFLGPDAADRFDVETLRGRFSDVARWLGEASDRQVMVSADETMAWFDERLASSRVGELRGSGVLRRAGGGQTERGAEGRWQIVQYHVAMPVPNQLVPELIEKLRDHDQETGRQPVDYSTPIVESADAPAGSAQWLLRDVHLAKTEGNGERYFGLFAPEAVALGTDRSERFSAAAWRAIFGPYYARGGRRPPTIPIEQRVNLTPDGDLAWFDQLVERQHLGRMRGTGVMARIDGVWKFLHYNVVLVVPSELTPAFAGRIKAFYAPSQEVHHAR